MRDLSDEFKLSVRSVGEVFQALNAMVSRLAVDRRVRFRGKKPTRAAVVNAALLYLDSLPPEQWERALALGLGRLERLLEAGGDAPAADPGPPRRVEVEVEDVTPPPESAKAVRRKQRG